jgi:ubiquinone/menaquinone biosynthesis C-methylase UbiE
MTYDNSIKKIAELYDARITSTKDAVKAAGQWGSDDFVPLICKEICSKIKLKQSDTILELGCGSGVLGNWIIDKCSKYVGIDLSSKMLNHFLNNSNKALDLIQGTTDLTAFKDNSFDIIILNGVTMYFSNEILANTLKEMKRVVSPSGVIFIGENIVPSGYFWEFVWFQNLSPTKQRLLLPYVKFRKWLAKNPKFAGKWKSIHNEISPKLIKEFFSDFDVQQTNAAAFTVKKQQLGSKYKGNRRADFLIKFRGKII